MAIVGLSTLAYPVSATTLPAGSGSGQGLEISPPVVELSANPGQTITTQIRVRNVTSGPLVVTGEADDFGAGTDESGTPKILTKENGQTRYSLKYWVSAVPDLTLAPQELKTNIITISIPPNAEPGGHYAVVRFTGVPASLSGTGVALSASVGTLILLRVNGAITENVKLAQFSTGHESTTDTWTPMGFFQHGPVDFLVRLQNTGSVHEKAQGWILIKDMFGNKVAQLTVNADGGNVLPASIRRFVSTWSNKKLLGKYTATLALSYAGNKTVSGNLSFWVIPWELILLILVGLVVVVYLLRVGLKRYNEHIIAMARKHR